MNRALAPLWSTLAAGLLLAACGAGGDETAKPAAAPVAAAPPPMPVEAATVQPAPLAREIVAVGSLRSDESVVLRPEIAGRIVAIGFKEGEPVARGQNLFQLDDSVFRAQADQARAGQALARRNHDRATELFARKMVSAAERDTARANLDVADAALALANAQLAKTRIVAPFAAVAGLRRVSPGDYVSAGQDLVNLEAMNPLKVDFRLAEVALPLARVGLPLAIEVDAWPGQRFAGTVYAVDPRIADETRSVGVRARLPNDDGRLRPGLFARVRLQVGAPADVLQVPEQAIFPRGEELFVYVIEDGKAQLRPVRVGQRSAGRAEITEGLAAGETVITAGVQKIGPGAPVSAVNLPHDGAAPPKG